MGVYVLEVDFTALIPWENGSEQGEERMFLVTHPLQHLCFCFTSTVNI